MLPFSVGDSVQTFQEHPPQTAPSPSTTPAQVLMFTSNSAHLPKTVFGPAAAKYPRWFVQCWPVCSHNDWESGFVWDRCHDLKKMYGICLILSFWGLCKCVILEDLIYFFILFFASGFLTATPVDIRPIFMGLLQTSAVLYCRLKPGLPASITAN